MINFSPFGNRLIQSGYINPEDLRKAMFESRQSVRPLTEVLESITGRQLPPDLLRQYKKQQLFELKILFGVECFDPEITQIQTEQVWDLVEYLIPKDICRLHCLVPLSSNKTIPASIVVAMVNPDDQESLDVLHRILRPQGLNLQRMVIARNDFQQFLLEINRQEQGDLAFFKRLENININTVAEILNAFRACQSPIQEIKLFNWLATRSEPPVTAFLEILEKIKLESILALTIQAFGQITNANIKSNIKESRELLGRLSLLAESGSSDLVRWSAAKAIEEIEFDFLMVAQYLSQDPKKIIEDILESKTKQVSEKDLFWIYGARK
ncbi:hypothetical protein NIES2119_29500 [[Phormidium ambiguum] IAM M-71]|uniref:Type II secretion system protein GspE N-terminal domain-containing protein n=1 Tax=[Phormidium ambiguum] IAM M-71 TaxID=454136 RepID=A0A1U7I4P4_9CYAN|nr:hypothetical protein [Phormidium ambiguum]OKH31107.1 hypothetical protein NIES2119_29500 [Phormidium ambiguum IAM M-71]